MIAVTLAAACTTRPEPGPVDTALAFQAPRRVELLASESGMPDALMKDAPDAPPEVAARPSPADVDPAPLRMPTEWRGSDAEQGPFRDQGARTRRMPAVQKLFDDAGVKYPAAEVLFRVFKKENKLEVWANDEKGTPLKPIATYGICYASGGVGPKRHEGDLQVPEGFYKLPHLWADTNYHLAMDVSYPNPYDRVQSPVSPGGQILIHGSCVSIGCISMSDERIEELWTIAAPLYRMGGAVELHIYPSRDMKGVMEDPANEKYVAFWKLLEPTLDKFNDDHLMPKIAFDYHGHYTVDGKPIEGGS